MTPFYIKTSVCGSSQWKEVTGYYVKKDGKWCEVTEGQIKTDVCPGSTEPEFKVFYSNVKIEAGVVLWTVDTTAPTGTVVADGSGVTSGALFDLLTDSGNLNSDGDPLFGGDLTTPLLPDIQGSNRFIRARSGNSSTTGVGVYEDDAVPAHTHKYNKIDDGDGSILIPGPPATFISFNEENVGDLREPSANTNGEIGSGTALASAGTETRPNNIAFTPVLGTEQISTVPVGSFIWYTSNTVPNGYLLCDGSAVTSTYNSLRQILIDAGNPFGTDGSDPRLPDLITDNRFIRGAGGSLAHGTTQTHNLKTHEHSFTVNRQSGIGDGGPRNAEQFTTILSGPVQGTDTADETRPNCIALLPVLKY